MFGRRGRVYGGAPGTMVLMSEAWEAHTSFPLPFYRRDFSHTIAPNTEGTRMGTQEEQENKDLGGDLKSLQICAFPKLI